VSQHISTSADICVLERIVAIRPTATQLHGVWTSGSLAMNWSEEMVWAVVLVVLSLATTGADGWFE